VTTNRKTFLAEKGCNSKDRVREVLSLIDGAPTVRIIYEVHKRNIGTNATALLSVNQVMVAAFSYHGP